MSQDFIKVLVKDDRLSVTDAISYAVEVGGQNMTCAQFNAISQSTSSITFNVQVPSEQTLIDRRVLWKSTVVLALNCVGVAGQLPVNIAVSDALSAFPLHQLATVMTATINNNSVSLNVRDLLPSFLRLHDKRELSRYNGMTPTAPDLLSVYTDGIGSNLNSLGGWSNAGDNDLLPRGAFQLDGVSTVLTNGLIGAQTLPSINYTGVLYVQFTVTEPLLLSPFIWCDPVSNNQAFYGIQNLNFVFNMGDASRVWRTANNDAISSVSVVSYNNTQLLFNFLTPHPSDLFPARNCVSFWEAPRYISSPNVLLAPTIISLANIPPVVSQLATSSLQLNQIPDKLIICVRKPIGSQDNKYPDAFMCIKGLSIQFNNQSGILASASTQDIYRYSVENGSNQSWEEFSGFATIADPASGIGRKIPTSGSLLILKFGKDIQLTESYYAPGSLGNFNLQINFQCFNQTPTACTPEIMISTINSGLFVNERGTSSTYTGILTKADVMAAIAQEPYYQSSVKRLVGGGFLDSLKSVAGKVLPHLLKHGKEELEKSDHPVAQVASHALNSMGYGTSGGGSSGGRMKLADRLMMK